MANPHEILEILQAGIDSVRPSYLFPRIFASRTIPGLLPWQQTSDRFLLTIGKAAVESAQAILRETEVSDYRVLSPPIENQTLADDKVLIGSHPIPDEHSFRATEKLLAWLDRLPDRSKLLIVLSGGSSALLAAPAEGISYDSKAIVNQLLIRCGAPIHEINAVRKHVSRVKGGKLAEKIRRLNSLVLVISDVIGDNLETIGSGPFYCDPTTFAHAKQVAERYNVWPHLPEDVQKHIIKGVQGIVQETPKPGQAEVPHFIIASNATARDACARKSGDLGYAAVITAGLISGFVDDAAQHIGDEIEKLPEKTALIMGGEVTVRWRGSGKGGRNQHLCLLLSERLQGKLVVFAAAGTDGIDGNSPAAGAWIDGDTAARARAAGLDFQRAIHEFESYEYFRRLNQTIETGPSGTNVMDLYIVIR